MENNTKNNPVYASTLWDEFSGEEVEKLFEKRPELADVQDWSELGGRDWVEILLMQPRLADKCDWEKLGCGDWAFLLTAQPQFADKCDKWVAIPGPMWASLLQDQPQFADKFEMCEMWSRMDVSSTVALLEKQPQFFDKCNWWELNDREWRELIKRQPQLAGKRDWSKLDGKAWATLLSKRPRFVDKCDWEKLGSGDWSFLLGSQPQFADKCDKLAGMSGSDWASLLQAQPQFADKCDWSKLNGNDWRDLLEHRPQFADKCDWTKLDGINWALLLHRHPQYADKCDKWAEISDSGWVLLLQWQPQFADKCDKWAEISGLHWALLLKAQPRFANKCDKWAELSGRDWRKLLEKHPEFADKCDWSKVVGDDWRYLSIKNPQFATSRRKWLAKTRSKARVADEASIARKKAEQLRQLGEIRRLLSDDSEKAFDAIWRMDYLPESPEKPFGPCERLVSDAICDRSLPKTTRARLLRRVGNNCTFNGLSSSRAQDVPLGFLDTAVGRQWYCKHDRPGHEVVCCSDPILFKNFPRKDYSDDVDLEKANIDPRVRRAVKADSPAQLMMNLSLLGKKVDAQLLAVILMLGKTNILEWLLENDGKTKKILGERGMLFYICANWPYQDATDWLEKAEAKQPGILKSCVDALGRNLLWYTQYNRRHGRAEETLLKHGCDSDAETAWGLSWRDMKAAR